MTRFSMKWSLELRNRNTSPRFGAFAVDQRRGQLTQQQRGRRPVAVVSIVAHLECLADDGPQVDRPPLLQGFGQDRSEDVLDPPEPIDDLRCKRPVAEHLAESLVERGVGDPVSVGVLDDRDRHRR